MTDKTPTPTHSGWFLLCPIYAREDDSDHEGLQVWARHEWLEPLFSLMHYVQAGFIFVASRMFPDHEFGWVFYLAPIQSDFKGG